MCSWFLVTSIRKDLVSLLFKFFTSLRGVTLGHKHFILWKNTQSMGKVSQRGNESYARRMMDKDKFIRYYTTNGYGW